jgi:hypothetical protein
MPAAPPCSCSRSRTCCRWRQRAASAIRPTAAGRFNGCGRVLGARLRTRTQGLQGRRRCRNPGSRLPAFGPYMAAEPRLSGHVAFYQSNPGPRFGHIQERFSIFLIFYFCCPSNAFASVSPVIVQTCHLCISAVIALPEKHRRTPQSSLSI